MFFTKDRGAFDKGHIVRRDDVAWGTTYEELACQRRHLPRHELLAAGRRVQPVGKGEDNWGELENHVLTQAATERYCVSPARCWPTTTRSSSAQDDARQRARADPAPFLKVVVARGDGRSSRRTAFVLEQDLSDTPLEFVVDAEWRRRMISIDLLERRTRLLSFDQALHDGDQIDTPKGEAIQAHPAIGKVEQ